MTSKCKSRLLGFSLTVAGVLAAHGESLSIMLFALHNSQLSELGQTLYLQFIIKDTDQQLHRLGTGRGLAASVHALRTPPTSTSMCSATGSYMTGTLDKVMGHS